MEQVTCSRSNKSVPNLSKKSLLILIYSEYGQNLGLVSVSLGFLQNSQNLESHSNSILHEGQTNFQSTEISSMCSDAVPIFSTHCDLLKLASHLSVAFQTPPKAKVPHKYIIGATCLYTELASHFCQDYQERYGRNVGAVMALKYVRGIL